MVSTSEARLRLSKSFPFLTDHNFGLTSPQDTAYNCIAWAANDNTRWWWPGDPFGYWPVPGAPNTLQTFEEAFKALGYEVCVDGEAEAGFEKVAIYAINDEPKHAARQTSDGKWTSKLGKEWDIWHEQDALNGPVYGEPVLFFRRNCSLNT